MDMYNLFKSKSKSVSDEFSGSLIELANCCKRNIGNKEYISSSEI